MSTLVLRAAAVLEKLAERTGFPVVAERDTELARSAIVRLCFGVLLLACAGVALSRYGAAPAYIVLAFNALFIVGGFCTPLACALCALLLPGLLYFREEFVRFPDGVFLAGLLCLFFLAAQAGGRYSLDAWLIQRRPAWPLSKVLQYILDTLALPDARQLGLLRTGLFLAFSAYGLYVNLACLPLAVVPNILAVVFVAYSVLLLLLLPLALVPGLRRSLAYSGLLLLPVLTVSTGDSGRFVPELLLWLLLMFPRRASQQAIAILYDDYCNLCKKAVSFLHKLNFTGVFTFKPLSRNAALAEEYGLSAEEIRANIHGMYNGKVHVGYDLYLHIARLHPLLLALWPLLLLGKVLRIGPMFYARVARKRYRYFGQCELSFSPYEKLPDALGLIRQRGAQRNRIILTAFLVCIFMLALYAALGFTIAPAVFTPFTS